MSSIWNLTVAGLIIYLIAVRLLRFKRRSSLHRYGYSDRASLRKMTLQNAFAIQSPLAELEFPRTFAMSIYFAIFKTYGIPSISALLVKTESLASLNAASKRAADTGILLVEAILNKPGSDRNLDAVARMNFLHDRYRKSGKIKDDDMLYTLSLFCLEPIRWTHRFEWRELTEVELCAMGVYWKSLGDQMNIPYNPLPSSRDGWQDGLHWLQELETWSTNYEIQNMLPAESNHLLSSYTLKLALTNVPRIFHSVVRQYISAFLDDRLRIAMKLPAPSRFMTITLTSILNIRKFTLRHLFLPRSESSREHWIDASPSTKTGRYYATHYVDRPWYIEPSFANRYHLSSWLLWLVGGNIPDEKRVENRPEGYRISELGPVNMEGKGIQEMNEAREMLKEMVRRCPFAHVPTG